ncbi:siderophore-interacting protein [Salana multivorans]
METPSTATERPTNELVRFPIRIRELTLLRRSQVTPLMIRIVLGGPQHEGFESHIADEHVKLIFPDPETGRLAVPTQDGDRLAWPRPGSPARDYTVRQYDRDAGEVTIDVVAHEGGIAATWAATAEIGSTIWVAGPPRGILIPDSFTWQAYLADETGLPAVARRLEELAAGSVPVRGVAVIEVRNAEEEQELIVPEGFEVRWVHRGDARPGTTRLLAEAAREIEIPRDGRAYAWFGGESGSIKPLRAWAKAAGLTKGQFDFVGYWRAGAAGDEVEHHGVIHALKHLLRIDH